MLFTKLGNQIYKSYNEQKLVTAEVSRIGDESTLIIRKHEDKESFKDDLTRDLANTHPVLGSPEFTEPENFYNALEDYFKTAKAEL